MPKSLLCAWHDKEASCLILQQLWVWGVLDGVTEEAWGGGAGRIPLGVLDRGSGPTHSKAQFHFVMNISL